MANQSAQVGLPAFSPPRVITGEHPAMSNPPGIILLLRIIELPFNNY